MKYPGARKPRNSPSPLLSCSQKSFSYPVETRNEQKAWIGGDLLKLGKKPGGTIIPTALFVAMFVLLMSTVLLAPTWFGLMGRDWGADAITDQQYGGQIAWGIGELPVLLLAIGIVTAWRRADAKETRRKDRQADRDHDAELRAYNEMLARTAQQDSTQDR